MARQEEDLVLSITHKSTQKFAFGVQTDFSVPIAASQETLSFLSATSPSF